MNKPYRLAECTVYSTMRVGAVPEAVAPFVSYEEGGLVQAVLVNRERWGVKRALPTLRRGPFPEDLRKAWMQLWSFDETGAPIPWFRGFIRWARWWIGSDAPGYRGRIRPTLEGRCAGLPAPVDNVLGFLSTGNYTEPRMTDENEALWWLSQASPPKVLLVAVRLLMLTDPVIMIPSVRQRAILNASPEPREKTP